MAAAKHHSRKKSPLPRERRDHFAQHVVAGLRVLGIAHGPAAKKARQHPVPIRFADHQQAAVAAPFATGRGVVEAAHRLHLRQLGHQRIATGLTQQQPRLTPVGQQILGVIRRRVPRHHHAAFGQQRLYRLPQSLGLLTVDGIHRKGHAFSHVLLPPAPARQSPDGRSPPPPGG
ncbi:hypothetical protein SB00610_03625 [Klebsiella quasipneumoniae subsp. similipneumoniae]|nr:hypothetical protein SB00610_03625 [Klebsiella quasipneumoniae subsp. similipneumoniae]